MPVSCSGGLTRWRVCAPSSCKRLSPERTASAVRSSAPSCSATDAAALRGRQNRNLGFHLCHPHRAAQPRSAQAAIAVRNFREILLVVVLRKVELWRIHDLGGDGTVAVGGEDPLIG